MLNLNLLNRQILGLGMGACLLWGSPVAAVVNPMQRSLRDSPQPASSRPALWIGQRSSPPSSLDFSDVGRPRRRQGGGSRGACLIADKPPLTALVPPTSTGYTIAQSPSFWFYVPYTLTEDHALEFVLKDSQENTVYRHQGTGKEITPGIVNLRLPATVNLDPNQRYEWYFLVHCDVQNQERFVFVNGAIARLDQPDLQQQVARTAASERSSLYHLSGFWYDALDVAASQMQANPQDSEIRRSWIELLAAVELDHLSTEPIQACCVPMP